MSIDVEKKKVPKGKRIGVVLLLVIGVMASWVMWQFNEGKQLAERLTTEAEQSVQEGSETGTLNESDKTSSDGTRQGSTSAEASEGTPQDATRNTPGQGTTPNSPNNPGGTQNSGQEKTEVKYKALVAATYSSTLQTMGNVKDNTLALQSRKISVSEYKASIVQAKARFSTYEEFLISNPPSDPNLRASYQEFLSGVKIARESMDVVLSGISSLNPSSLYAARDMGKTALDKVVNAYKGF